MAQTAEEIAAREAIEAQLLARDDRRLAGQRANVDTSKLVVTFVLALAGALVGTALQVDPRGPLDIAAVAVLAVALLGVLAVIALDRLDVPVFTAVDPHASDIQKHGEMKAIIGQVLSSNDKKIEVVRAFTLVSIGLSSFAGVLSTVSLLLK